MGDYTYNGSKRDYLIKLENNGHVTDYSKVNQVT